VSVGLEQAERGLVLEVREAVEMGRVAWQERIVIAPDLHHGDPCIKGTRIPVAMIVGSLADGMTMAQIREAYPQLTNEDIRAALAYAAELTHEEILIPLSA
jgi:uncharacterized protein (DUF433 family)